MWRLVNSDAELVDSVIESPLKEQYDLIVRQEQEQQE